LIFGLALTFGLRTLALGNIPRLSSQNENQPLPAGRVFRELKKGWVTSRKLPQWPGKLAKGLMGNETDG
jgi:hypothetical protein